VSGKVLGIVHNIIEIHNSVMFYGLTIFYGIFLTFSLNVRNTWRNISPHNTIMDLNSVMSVKILMIPNRVGYMLTSSGDAFIHLEYIFL
jgi:prolipoprotein diacylglyceryltransferase